MAAIDPNPKNFPILSYVLSRIPSITHLRQSSPQATASAAADHDIEQPLPPSDFVDPLIVQMPHLKDPNVIAAMTKTVSEIAQTRSVLQALGERPDHETVDIAKVKLAKIEAELSDQLEEIELSPGGSGESEKQKREALENEKTMYKAVIQVDEMHDAYQKLLHDAEERLTKIYDSVAESGKEVEEESVDEEVDEEVVAVLRQQTIERVDLSGRKLRILPEAVGRLRGIVSLNLSTNQLQAIPDSIAGCENLEELNLSSNSLQSLPDSIGLLLKLRILSVVGNKLSALPDSISNCRSLVELDASFNVLEYLPTAMGFQLVNLRKLLVGYNKIRYLPTSIGDMKSLQHLDVHFNELHGVPATIGQLTNLVTLNLSGNFSDMKELPDTFCDLINLEELDLSNNQIHALPNQFGRLGKLKKLNLEQNPIVVPPMEVIKNGIQAVRVYMDERWSDIVEEEERAKQEVEEVKEGGWLKRSVSKLGGVVSSVSEYLVSPKSRDPDLDIQL